MAWGRRLLVGDWAALNRESCRFGKFKAPFREIQTKLSPIDERFVQETHDSGRVDAVAATPASHAR